MNGPLLSAYDVESMLQLDFRNFLSELRDIYQQDKPSQLFDDYRNTIIKEHNEAILTLATHENKFESLRLKLRPYFAHWQFDYALILKFLLDAGYRFETMTSWKSEMAQTKTAILRYDVHCRDMPGLYGYLDINKILGLPSDSYIFWDHSQVERNFQKHFSQLAKFEVDANTHVGFHGSPGDSHLIWSMFGGDEKKEIKWFKSSEAKAFVENLGSSILNNSKVAEKFNEECFESLKKQMKSFRTVFPNSSITSAHGGALEREIQTKVWKDTATFFLPSFSERQLVNYLKHDSSWKLEAGNLHRKYNFFRLSDGDLDTKVFVKNMLLGMERGKGLELLCHPAILHNQRGLKNIFAAMCDLMGIKSKRVSIYPATSSDINRKTQIDWIGDIKKPKNASWSLIRNKVTLGVIKKLIRNKVTLGVIKKLINKINKMTHQKLNNSYIEINDIRGELADNSITGCPINYPKSYSKGTRLLNLNFHHDPIPIGAIVKLWLVPCDADGVKSKLKSLDPKNLIKNTFKEGEDISIVFPIKSDTTHFKVILQYAGINKAWKINTKVELSKNLFP